MQPQQSRRIEWIDIVKGILIASIMVGHLGIDAVNQIVFIYHVGGFFLLSGYTMKARRLTAASVGIASMICQRVAQSLIVPDSRFGRMMLGVVPGSLFVLAGFLLYHVVAGEEPSDGSPSGEEHPFWIRLRRLCGGLGIPFAAVILIKWGMTRQMDAAYALYQITYVIPVMFGGGLLVLLVHRALPRWWEQWLLVLLLSLAGVLLGENGHRVLWSDLMLYSTIYMQVGYELAHARVLEQRLSGWLYFVLGLVFASMVCLGGVNMGERQLEPFGTALMGVTAGFLLLWMGGQRLMPCLPAWCHRAISLLARNLILLYLLDMLMRSCLPVYGMMAVLMLILEIVVVILFDKCSRGTALWCSQRVDAVYARACMQIMQTRRQGSDAIKRVSGWYRRHPVLMAFLLNLVLAFLTFIPYIYMGQGMFALSNDFNAEQIPFNIYANDSIKSGNIWWSWTTDMGSDFLTSYSFYNLGSPFFWLSLLFPGWMFPYLVGWIYMLKYAVCGMIAFLFLRDRVHKYSSALIGSCLYAFSGFLACVTVFYHFHEVVAFFPLMIMGIDALILHERRGRFVFAVAINALVNYNFFVGETIFVILYYLVRYGLCERPRCGFWKGAFRCLIEAVLGVGIACVLFLPSVMMILHNPRVSDHADPTKILFDAEEYFLMVRGWFFPAEAMSILSAGPQTENWYSNALYLPLVGPAPAIAYVAGTLRQWIRSYQMGHHRGSDDHSHEPRAGVTDMAAERGYGRMSPDYLTVLLLVCLGISLSYILNSSFVMFTREPYHRWFYMFILFLVLATARVLDDVSAYPWMQACGFCLVVAGGYVGYSLITEGFIHQMLSFRVISWLGMAGYLLTIWQFARLRDGRSAVMLMGLVGVMAVVTTAWTMTCYRGHSHFQGAQAYYEDVIRTGEDMDADVLPYRYHYWDSYYNRTLAANLPSINSFNSTVEPTITTFYQALVGGEGRHNWTPDVPEGTDALLSVRYLVSYTETEETLYSTQNGILHVSEVEETLPIGYVQHAYILRSEFDQLPVEQRAIAMVKYLVVPDESEALVSERMTHAAVDASTVFTSEDLSAAVRERQQECTSEFSYDTRHMRSVLSSNGDGYVFLSVPYSTSWHATVDGEETEILATNGLMAVPVTDGEHEIVLSYSNWSRTAGAAMSIVSLVLTALYCGYYRRSRSPEPVRR